MLTGEQVIGAGMSELLPGDPARETAPRLRCRTRPAARKPPGCPGNAAPSLNAVVPLPPARRFPHLLFNGRKLVHAPRTLLCRIFVVPH